MHWTIIYSFSVISKILVRRYALHHRFCGELYVFCTWIMTGMEHCIVSIRKTLFYFCTCPHWGIFDMWSINSTSNTTFNSYFWLSALTCYSCKSLYSQFVVFYALYDYYWILCFTHYFNYFWWLLFNIPLMMLFDVFFVKTFWRTVFNILTAIFFIFKYLSVTIAGCIFISS